MSQHVLQGGQQPLPPAHVHIQRSVAELPGITQPVRFPAALPADRNGGVDPSSLTLPIRIYNQPGGGPLIYKPPDSFLSLARGEHPALSGAAFASAGSSIPGARTMHLVPASAAHRTSSGPDSSTPSKDPSTSSHPHHHHHHPTFLQPGGQAAGGLPASAAYPAGSLYLQQPTLLRVGSHSSLLPAAAHPPSVFSAHAHHHSGPPPSGPLGAPPKGHPHPAPHHSLLDAARLPTTSLPLGFAPPHIPPHLHPHAVTILRNGQPPTSAAPGPPGAPHKGGVFLVSSDSAGGVRFIPVDQNAPFPYLPLHNHATSTVSHPFLSHLQSRLDLTHPPSGPHPSSAGNTSPGPKTNPAPSSSAAPNVATLAPLDPSPHDPTPTSDAAKPPASHRPSFGSQPQVQIIHAPSHPPFLLGGGGINRDQASYIRYPPGVVQINPRFPPTYHGIAPPGSTPPATSLYPTNIPLVIRPGSSVPEPLYPMMQMQMPFMYTQAQSHPSAMPPAASQPVPAPTLLNPQPRPASAAHTPPTTANGAAPGPAALNAAGVVLLNQRPAHHSAQPPTSAPPGRHSPEPPPSFPKITLPHSQPQPASNTTQHHPAQPRKAAPAPPLDKPTRKRTRRESNPPASSPAADEHQHPLAPLALAPPPHPPHPHHALLQCAACGLGRALSAFKHHPTAALTVPLICHDCHAAGHTPATLPAAAAHPHHRHASADDRNNHPPCADCGAMQSAWAGPQGPYLCLPCQEARALAAAQRAECAECGMLHPKSKLLPRDQRHLSHLVCMLCAVSKPADARACPACDRLRPAHAFAYVLDDGSQRPPAVCLACVTNRELPAAAAAGSGLPVVQAMAVLPGGVLLPLQGGPGGAPGARGGAALGPVKEEEALGALGCLAVAAEQLEGDEGDAEVVVVDERAGRKRGRPPVTVTTGSGADHHQQQQQHREQHREHQGHREGRGSRGAKLEGGAASSPRRGGSGGEREGVRGVVLPPGPLRVKTEVREEHRVGAEGEQVGPPCYISAVAAARTRPGSSGLPRSRSRSSLGPKEDPQQQPQPQPQQGSGGGGGASEGGGARGGRGGGDRDREGSGTPLVRGAQLPALAQNRSHLREVARRAAAAVRSEVMGAPGGGAGSSGSRPGSPFGSRSPRSLLDSLPGGSDASGGSLHQSKFGGGSGGQRRSSLGGRRGGGGGDGGDTPEHVEPWAASIFMLAQAAAQVEAMEEAGEAEAKRARRGEPVRRGWADPAQEQLWQLWGARSVPRRSRAERSRRGGWSHQVVGVSLVRSHA